MSQHNSSPPATAFDGVRLLAAGPLAEVARAVKGASENGAVGPILVFDDTSGRVIDLDLRGSEGDVIHRLVQSSTPEPAEGAAEPRGRGRPKLGVVGREVTLLPRHWDWLNAQPGGASVVLRELVEEARRTGGAKQHLRAAQESAYRVMHALAGDLPGFEEASRALFAANRAGFDRQVAHWPEDVRAYMTRLAFERPAG